MKLEVKDAGKAKVLEMRGHMTLVDEGHARLVFNMQHLTRLDSAGIGEMIACVLRVRRDSGNIHLLPPSDRVLSLLGVVGLRTHFRVFDTEIEAVGSF